SLQRTVNQRALGFPCRWLEQGGASGFGYAANHQCEPLLLRQERAHIYIRCGIVRSAAWYCDHLPLYRQSQIYQRDGIDLDPSTLADWVGSASDLLGPLVTAIRDYVFK